MNNNFRKFLLLWAGELISSIGGGLTSFGLGVYVFNKTGSATGMAIATLMGFLPTLLFSIPAGVLADRYDRRMLMMLGDGLSALGVIYIYINLIHGTAGLIEICVGVFISAVFSSLLEPAYRSTISDLLTQEEYTKASGLIGVAGSARYLVSPIIAGLLLSTCDVSVLLLIDICTFIVTVTSTAVVRKGISSKVNRTEGSFFENLNDGWRIICANKGVLILIMISSVMTIFVGSFQILAEPLVLSFSTSKVLGICESIIALGMVMGSVYIGVKGIRNNHVKVMSLSLAVAGLAMIGFAFKENIYVIGISGFIFFLSLPFANTCLDYLVRTNISNESIGRAWGFIGFLSQLGYVVAYGFSGISADSVAKLFGISVGRGASSIIMISGALLIVIAVLMRKIKQINNLEN